jgi:GrpB-like predicted nucleotidyltransferase (UPF0157 family)
MARTIEVVEHDPHWVASFGREAASLRAVFGDRAMAIYHIGSTAVPGLDAKPIIDILVVLEETGSIQSFDAAMEALGYRVRGECLDAIIPGTPGRFYFTKDTAGVRTHHVHACAHGHSEILDKLAFRDYLRAHPADAAAYGQLKQRLALAHRHDNVGYMQGKDAFVKATLADARRWYQAEENEGGSNAASRE